MLFLLPNLLGPNQDWTQFLPKSVGETVSKLDGLIAEDAKEGRAYLKMMGTRPNLPMAILNEHTKPTELEILLKPIIEGQNWGLVSDAGLPCIADPGSALVFLAHQKNIPVIAHVGPSAITMALMLSGLPGQRFSFHGYISRDEREKDLKNLELRSQDETVIFMEAPYRNLATFQTCLQCLKKNTFLSIASDLTLPTQFVATWTINEWLSQNEPPIQKHPTLFLIKNI